MNPVWTLDTPSGSRASPGYHWEGDAMTSNEIGIDDGFDPMNYQEEDEDYFTYSGRSSTMQSGLLPQGVKMTTKIPPSFDGRTNWFLYEQLVREWADTCAIPQDKQY